MTEVAKALNRQRQQEESYLHLNGGQAEDIQVGQIDVSGASLFPTYDKYKKRIPPQRIVSRCGGTPAYSKKRRRPTLPRVGQYQAKHAALRLGRSLGQLVALGFGVAAFTPAPYLRHRL